MPLRGHEVFFLRLVTHVAAVRLFKLENSCCQIHARTHTLWAQDIRTHSRSCHTSAGTHSYTCVFFILCTHSSHVFTCFSSFSCFFPFTCALMFLREPFSNICVLLRPSPNPMPAGGLRLDSALAGVLALGFRVWVGWQLNFALNLNRRIFAVLRGLQPRRLSTFFRALRPCA